MVVTIIVVRLTAGQQLVVPSIAARVVRRTVVPRRNSVAALGRVRPSAGDQVDLVVRVASVRRCMLGPVKVVEKTAALKVSVHRRAAMMNVVVLKVTVVPNIVARNIVARKHIVARVVRRHAVMKVVVTITAPKVVGLKPAHHRVVPKVVKDEVRMHVDPKDVAKSAGRKGAAQKPAAMTIAVPKVAAQVVRRHEAKVPVVAKVAAVLRRPAMKTCRSS